MTVRELRTSMKLSQAKFAEEIGVSQVTIAHLESGRMKLSERIADKIWQAFGVEVHRGEDLKPASAGKPRTKKTEIYIQSPLGGNITPEEVAAKIPAGTEAAFVRVDQNKIWWVRGEETGSVEIWQ